MRRLVGLLAVLLFAGCASLGAILPILVGDDDQPSVPVCVAQYDLLGPSTDLGSDGCGNLWLRYRIGPVPECFIISGDSTEMVRIPCPVEGDSLGAQ